MQLHEPQSVGVLVLPGGSRMAAFLLLELLEAANGLLPAPRSRVEIVQAGDAAWSQRSWQELWLVAPWRLLAGSEALNQLPQQLLGLAAAGCRLGAVEGGALWLAAAGLLKGRRVCSIDWLTPHLQQQHPDVVWSQSLYEVDATPGRPVVLSCARPLALPDLLLAQLGREQGEPFARQLAGRLGLSSVRARDERVVGEAGGHALMPPKLAEALALMQANLAEPLPTDDVARLVGLSRRQLERLFKQHLDALPSRHYLDLRLSRSRELLQRTGQSILQVGLACGFSSGPHFSNAYKAAFGCTPREERAREAQRIDARGAWASPNAEAGTGGAALNGDVRAA